MLTYTMLPHHPTPTPQPPWSPVPRREDVPGAGPVDPLRCHWASPSQGGGGDAKVTEVEVKDTEVKDVKSCWQENTPHSPLHQLDATNAQPFPGRLYARG